MVTVFQQERIPSVSQDHASVEQANACSARKVTSWTITVFVHKLPKTVQSTVHKMEVAQLARMDLICKKESVCSNLWLTWTVRSKVITELVPRAENTIS